MAEVARGPWRAPNAPGTCQVITSSAATYVSSTTTIWESGQGGALSLVLVRELFVFAFGRCSKLQLLPVRLIFCAAGTSAATYGGVAERRGPHLGESTC